MQHPYLSWKAGYENQLASMVIERKTAVDAVAQHILQPANWQRYMALQEKTGVPAAFIGALDYREGDCKPNLGLGQGDPWDKVSVHVPRGCGPFASWLDAAVFYVHYDHLDDNSAPWSLSYDCWKGEIWNGLGYRYHGVPSPYLFGGTNLQRKGKFISDGHWDPDAVDQQLGIMPIIFTLGQLNPAAMQPFTSGSATRPELVALAPTQWLQHRLNALHLVPADIAPLVEDGSYGRRTRMAVRMFQLAHGLTPDGICGPETSAALLALKDPEHV